MTRLAQWKAGQKIRILYDIIKLPEWLILESLNIFRNSVLLLFCLNCVLLMTVVISIYNTSNLIRKCIWKCL